MQLTTTVIALALTLASANALPKAWSARRSEPLSARGSDALLPVTPNADWTVSSQLPNPLPFTDATLQPTKEASDFSHPFVAAPDGVQSIQAHYPAGSFNPSGTPRGGLSFYSPGPASVDLTTAQEATLSYTVLFGDDFDFVKGGKLPGLYGGNSAEEAFSCSGGRRDDGCWSARFMWRTNGAGELYTYLPPDSPENKAVCSIPPLSDCNDVFGASVGRGSFTFTPGKRTTIGQRVKLNDVGQANGELELFVEGQSLFTVPGLVLRTNETGTIRGIQMQSFFGGSDSSWATPKDVDAFFGDFTVAITQKL